MRWLLDVHGKEAVLHLVRTLPRDASRAEIDGAFRSAFGVGLDNAFAAWKSSQWYAPATLAQSCLFALEGSGAPPAFERDVSLAPTCHDSSPPYAIMRVDIPATGAWVIWMEAGAPQATSFV